jgi:hypothetical protein
MKNNIEPMWEHEDNKNGGVYKIRIPKNQSVEYWTEICMMVFGQTLFKNIEDNKYLNGISISHTGNTSIINLWDNNSKVSLFKKFNNLDFLKNKFQIGEIKYKKY